MKRIAILGGTFNPIHTGHIKLAQKAMEQYKIDSVWIMPNNKPGYKSNEEIASSEDRCRMVELAIKDYSYMKLSCFEIEREGTTYTADTLKLLCNKYSDVEWYFIMGADSLFYFHKWRKPQEILKYAHILVAVRDDISTEQIKQQIALLSNKYNPCNISLLNFNYVDISSSHIRECVKKGDRISNMVPDNVAKYIFEKGLYTHEQN